MVVTVEVWPKGVREERYHMGTAYIANVGGTAEKADYKVKLSKWVDRTATWKEGSIKGFPRRRLGPWDLLYRCLRACVEDRNRK